jgi:hypothetical protein
MSRLVVAALVLLLTVGGLFGAAAWNRRGDVQAIVLSERELALPGGWPSDDADARLRLQWQGRHEPQDARLWLTDMKLRELGFITGVSAGAPEAERTYGRSLPRLAWVAFELEGPAWKALAERRMMIAPSADDERHFAPPRNESRLVPIDAAASRDPLRRRYANAPVIVLPAVIEMRYRNWPKEGPSVWAEVASLVAPDVSIPAHLRGRLPPGPRKADDDAPRYAVELRVGRLGAVWVEDIQTIVH